MTPTAAGYRDRKRVHHACLDNFRHYLSGEVSFDEWESRQEELESRLTPAPELPFGEDSPQEARRASGDSKETRRASDQTKAA
jgi:hypothetical protein